jgi:RNA polymerase sigma-70 factor (ECF subfamily)
MADCGAGGRPTARLGDTEGDQAGGILDAYRPSLWRLAYQLTGSPGEAEDIVQETFLRAIERWPPADERSLGRWLIRVATNLGIDALRRRKRSPYIGPWLPIPADTDAIEEMAGAFPPSDPRAEPEARYGLRESVTYAFLTALEVLTPRQRSVLLLRDVLDYSARETADVLSISEANVRIAHHRARRSLVGYDGQRCIPDAELSEATLRALGELITCLRQDDAAGLERLIADSAVVVTDAGGEFNALRAEMTGRIKIINFHQRVARRRAAFAVPQPCTVNGMPALFIRFTDERPRAAPRALLRCELDSDGRIRAVQWILASKKLAHLVPAGA